MSIRTTCPNGHRLKVADKHAGCKARCPKCQAQIRIPEKREVSSSTAVALLGDYDPSKSVVAAPILKPAVGDRRKCPQCKKGVPPGYKICPHCQTYLLER